MWKVRQLLYKHRSAFFYYNLCFHIQKLSKSTSPVLAVVSFFESSFPASAAFKSPKRSSSLLVSLVLFSAAVSSVNSCCWVCGSDFGVGLGFVGNGSFVFSLALENSELKGSSFFGSAAMAGVTVCVTAGVTAGIVTGAALLLKVPNASFVVASKFASTGGAYWNSPNSLSSSLELSSKFSPMGAGDNSSVLASSTSSSSSSSSSPSSSSSSSSSLSVS
ncbi:hypothetical protein ZYGR_0H04670 [Zygosaccharomyces rouxii]|uniref:Uncharacterized protein n=1 Tax=Zygosaccharomyces rouxii TaxID=4956 RepID=A0A1Q2ZVY4_ZYGRO|nr:hypothetical protein ZYGR_0H04670 [Zygosaccharomyces rouxii]